VDPRGGRKDLEKSIFLVLPGLEPRSLGRPAPSQSLYREHYRGSLDNTRGISYLLYINLLNIQNVHSSLFLHLNDHFHFVTEVIIIFTITY
jgi:hypothetical protein